MERVVPKRDREERDSGERERKLRVSVSVAATWHRLRRGEKERGKKKRKGQDKGRYKVGHVAYSNQLIQNKIWELHFDPRYLSKLS